MPPQTPRTDEYEWRCLGDVATVSWGDTTTTKAAYAVDGFPAYSAAGLDGALPYADHSEPGVVVSAIGARCGKTWFTPRQWSCIKNTLWFRAQPESACTRFLYYATSDPDSWPRRGAAQPFISLTDARKMRIPLPPLPAQRKIAAVLSAYDDLIENNTRRIKILEEMAQRIYREWFVDFRYPGHEGVPLVDSDRGLIPEGWRWGAFGDLARDVRESVIPDSTDAGMPYVGLEHMPRRSIAIDEWGDAIEAGSRKYRFQAGDILFGKIRPYFHKVSVPPADGICSSDAIVIRPLQDEWFGVAVSVAASDAFVEHAAQTAQGTKMPRANWSVLAEYPLAIPNDALLSSFDALIRPLVGLIHSLVLSGRSLRAGRDLLLPRLVSGEIDVTALDIAIPEAA
jgi:type I restriction enzyme S subunit